MKKFIEYLEIILLIILVGIVIWFILFKKEPVPEPRVEYVYVTDTIKVPVPYEVEKPFPVPTPPIQVVEYIVDSAALDSLTILLQNQSLILAGLRDSIKINEAYIKQYPTSPKLLALEAKRDSFSMDILNINGLVWEYIFPWDLNYYSYRWNPEVGFTRIDVPPGALPPTEKEPFANYFVGGAVDIWHTMPQLSFRAEKSMSSFRLYVDTRVGLLDLDRSSLSVGIEYQINGKKH